MADKKISETTTVVTLPDTALIPAIDMARTVGDRNIAITKSNLFDGAFSTSSIILDTSLDSFTGTTIATSETVKSYVIPANTFIDGDLMVIKAKFNRLIGTSNPALSLVVGINDIVNLVNNLTLDRHVVIQSGNLYKFPSSGNFPEDLSTTAGIINFTNFAWDETIINTINLQFQFEQIAVPEYQLMFLSIERIRP